MHPIIPREKLDFQLDAADIPRYWFDNDPYKTRFWDALSLIFPPGEKFFMTCVRDFKDRVTDPKLLSDIDAFNRQEAQHSRVHRQDNQRLQRQGIDTAAITQSIHSYLFEEVRHKYSKRYTLAITSALEHFTSITAHSLFDHRDIMQSADPRVRAMYAWHAIEEVEHKGVAYDMLTLAKVPYWMRVAALAHATVLFPKMIHLVQRQLLIADGFTSEERRQMSKKGIQWLIGSQGILRPMLRHYWSYYKPFFHPWDHTEQPGYSEWTSAFESSQDPLFASEQARASFFKP